MKKTAIALLLVLSLVMGLTACSSSKTDSSQNDDKKVETNDNKSSETDEAEQKDNASVREDLKIAVSAEPVRFFPCGPDGSNNNDLIVLNNIYEPLVYLNADGSLSPCLAETWEVSEDGLVYTFNLRKGVKFHDGSEMTAEDVVFTFDLASQNSTGKALIINFDHAEVVDEDTVAVYLTEPFAPFINGVASRAAYIISKKHYESVGVEGYLENPIGTGAYKFASKVSGDNVKLEAFEEHWAPATAIKKVEIKIMTDTTTQSIALENGDIDVVLSPAISSCIQLNEAAGAVWDSVASAGRVTLLVSENNGQPGMDKNFRKAVQAAVNKEDIVLGAMEGYADIIDIDMCPAYTAVPEGYDVVPYNVDKAKEYLAASNYNGEAFEVIVQAGTVVETVGQILQAQLMEVGINCTINAVDTATFNDLWYAGKFGGMLRITNSSLMDADGISNYYMAVPYAQTDNNQFGRTKELYDLSMEARKVQGDARKDLYKQIVNIVTEEAYQVPIFANTTTIAYNNGLSGVAAHPLNMVRFQEWSWK